MQEPPITGGYDLAVGCYDLICNYPAMLEHDISLRRIRPYPAGGLRQCSIQTGFLVQSFGLWGLDPRSSGLF